MLIHRRYLKDKVQISFQLDSQSTILGSYQNIPDETAETNIIENNFNPSFPQNITQTSVQTDVQENLTESTTDVSQTSFQENVSIDSNDDLNLNSEDSNIVDLTNDNSIENIQDNFQENGFNRASSELTENTEPIRSVPSISELESQSSEYTVSGFTNSRLGEFRDTNGNLPRTNESLKINGINAFITKNQESIIEYQIGKINYIEENGNTKFFVEKEITNKEKSPPLLIKNKEIIEDIQVDNNIFINRGTNSILEPMIRLKEAMFVFEVDKIGFNFYSINNQT